MQNRTSGASRDLGNYLGDAPSPPFSFNRCGPGAIEGRQNNSVWYSRKKRKNPETDPPATICADRVSGPPSYSARNCKS